jgi:hypothetical protein
MIKYILNTNKITTNKRNQGRKNNRQTGIIESKTFAAATK